MIRKHSTAIILFVCAFLVRVLFNVYVVGIQTPGSDFFVDWKEYDAVGLSLANGYGFTLHNVPYTTHPPGYPLLLAAIYAVFGHSYVAVKIVQSALGAFTCLVILKIGEILFSRRIGLIAAAVSVFYPSLVFYTGFLLSETLFVFLSTILLYVLVRLREIRTMGWAGLSGVVLGMMNLTRPTMLLLPALLFFWAWIEFGTQKQAAVLAGTLTALMMVTILPWTARNFLVTDSLVPIVTTHWVTLYGAHNEKIIHDPEAIGGWVQPDPMDMETYRSEYLTFMKHYLLHEPVELLRLELHKLKRFWSVFPKTKTAKRDGVISFFSYGLLLPLFMIGMVLSIKTPPTPWILFCWILYFCLITLITHGTTRYRLPVEPAIILFGSLTLEKVWSRFIREQGRSSAIIAV